MRKLFAWDEGTVLTFEPTGEAVRITDTRAALKQMQKYLSGLLVDDQDPVEEMLEQRREDARREAQPGH